MKKQNLNRRPHAKAKSPRLFLKFLLCLSPAFSAALIKVMLVFYFGQQGAPVTISRAIETELNHRRLISMSVETPASEQSQSNKISVTGEFSYYKSGDVIPEMERSERSLNAKNPVVRVYNKIERMNWLQWELNEWPEVPGVLMRPKTMNIQCPAGMSQVDALKKIEKSLDQNIASLEEMLAENSLAGRQLACAH